MPIFALFFCHKGGLVKLRKAVEPEFIRFPFDQLGAACKNVFKGCGLARFVSGCLQSDFAPAVDYQKVVPKKGFAKYWPSVWKKGVHY